MPFAQLSPRATGLGHWKEILIRRKNRLFGSLGLAVGDTCSTSQGPMLFSLDMRIEERRPPWDMLFIQITRGVSSQHAARSLYIANIGFSPE